MQKKSGKGIFRAHKKMVISLLIGFCTVGLVLAGCGTMASSTTNSTASLPVPASQHSAASTNDSGNGSQSYSASNNASQYGPQYLAKSLQVSMQVRDTVQAASTLQQWIAQTDTQSTSDGTDYTITKPNQYNVTLTFLVDASHYDQIEAYLRGYAQQEGGKLLSLHESVQDVTNDYVDTQSTLTNLRAEQQRLLSFMNQAQNLSDTLNIEQQLTQVEGQIDSIEAHLNELKGQTTFYQVTVTLQPLSTAVPSSPSSPSWSVTSIWQGAWSAVVAIWQTLAAILVWLAAFSVYIIPAGIVVWLAAKRPWRRSPVLATPFTMSQGSEPEPK